MTEAVPAGNPGAGTARPEGGYPATGYPASTTAGSAGAQGNSPGRQAPSGVPGSSGPSGTSGGNHGKGTRLPRNARRAQLLEAAQHVFVANGYHAAAMDEIAERAGVSKPVLYQHFPGKLELYIALLETHVDELTSRVRDALASTTDNKQRVRTTVEAFYDFVNSEGEAYRMIFESDLRGEPAVQQAVDRATNESVDAITETITADAGLDTERARLLAIGLVGLSQVSARSWLAAERPVPREEAISLIATLAWRGIGGGFPLQH